MKQILAEGMTLVEDRRPDGALLCRNSVPLPEDRPDILDRLIHWSRTRPDHVLLSAPQQEGGRRTITYRQALEAGNALRIALAETHGLRPGSRIAALAPAGIDALLLKLACLTGGFVHTTLPPFPFRDGERNPAAERLLEIVRPDLLLAPADHPALAGYSAIELNGPATEALAAPRPLAGGISHAPQDRAAIFFTSGSTGEPKGVPVTRAMISSCQAAICAMWPFMGESPVLIDWLPWHHVFGGLDNIFKMIWNGGTMHVDAPPGPENLDETVGLFAEVSPTVHIAVPLGLKLLVERFERDPAAARAFTARLEAIFFAGAGIDDGLWQRLRNLQEKYGQFLVLSGYGTTEAASTIALSPVPLERPGELGFPLPGHEIALVEADGRTELRVKGPNVASSYLTPQGETPLPTDEYGFYRTGDAALLRRRKDGAVTLGFDGRLAEDFKMSSGVKVRTGPLRAALMARLAPLADDIVIAGENRDELVALVFPSATGKHEAKLVAEIARRLAVWNGENGSASTRISRFDLADRPPDRTKGEISDKGQIVQSRFLHNRADLIAKIYSEGKPISGPAP